MGDGDGSSARVVKLHRKEVSFAPGMTPGAEATGTPQSEAAAPPKLTSRPEQASPSTSPRSLPGQAGHISPSSSSASPPASPGRTPKEVPATPRAPTQKTADLCPRSPLEFTTAQQRRQWVCVYLQSLKSKDLETLSFRDLKGDMAAWGGQFLAALAPAMHRARGTLLDELAKKTPHAIDNAGQQRELQRILRTGRSVAAALRPPGFYLPPLAMMMLAEALQELRTRLGEFKRSPEMVQSICDDAVRNILVQNGFLTSLTNDITGPSASMAFKVVTYVKAVFGMASTSQGKTAAIVTAVENHEREAATRFLASVCAKLAHPLSAVEIHWPDEDMDGDCAAAQVHAKVKRELFIETWGQRGRKSVEYRSRGLCHFLEADGRFKPWNSPASLAEWLGGAPSDPLPAAILHVAGPHLMRYIREYLLAGARGKELGLRPDAAFKFELAVLLRRDADEFVLDFRAVDENFKRKGLASRTDAEESDSVIESDNEEAADSRKVRFEVRLQIRFRRPDLFQMHSALVVKTEY